MVSTFDNFFKMLFSILTSSYLSETASIDQELGHSISKVDSEETGVDDKFLNREG